MARLWRKIGAAPERLAVGGEEHGQRPAALLAKGVQRRHVDLVDIGPLLAVDLDVDEGFVQIGGEVGVTETFAGHDVAPVTGGIADRKMYRDIASASFGKGVVMPRPPVHRVVGVLTEIGTAAGGEAIFGHLAL